MPWWAVVITVPVEATLKSVKLAVAAGNLDFSGFGFTEAEQKAEMGALILSGLGFMELELDAVAGSIVVRGSQGGLSVENIYDNVLLDGDFGEADASSVSGAVALTGAASLKAELETASGAITQVGVPCGSLGAVTVGKISCNGANQGKRFHRGMGAPAVELKSVSGDIVINHWYLPHLKIETFWRSSGKKGECPAEIPSLFAVQMNNWKKLTNKLEQNWGRQS